MYWTNLTSKVAGTYLCRRPCMVLKAMAKDILKYIPERLITFTSKNCNTADNKKVEKL